MNTTQNLAFMLFNGKKAEFKPIGENEFPLATAEELFKDKNMIFLQEKGFLFISTYFLGQIKNSFFTIRGKKIGRSTVLQYGMLETNIFDLENFTPKNSLPTTMILTAKGAGITVNAETDPIGWLTQWHQQTYKKSPTFSSPYEDAAGWKVDLDVDFLPSGFYGVGQNQKIARKEASKAAIQYLKDSNFI